MAKVWFVKRVGADWKKLSDQPAFERPLGDLIFRIDLGPQRRLGEDGIPEQADGSITADPRHAKAFVEVTPEDVAEKYFGGYFAGWYDSPYSAHEVARRLGAVAGR